MRSVGQPGKILEVDHAHAAGDLADPGGGRTAAPGDPVDVELGKHAFRISLFVEVVENRLAVVQMHEFEVVVVISEADPRRLEDRAFLVDDPDEFIQPGIMDAAVVFDRHGAHGREIAIQRFHAVDQAVRVAHGRKVLMRGDAGQIVRIKLLADDFRIQRNAGNLNGLIPDPAEFVQRAVKITFRLAVFTEVKQCYGDLSVGKRHFSVSFVLSLDQEGSGPCLLFVSARRKTFPAAPEDTFFSSAFSGV